MQTPLAPARLEDLQSVTAAAFGQRRKMLRQSLKVLVPNPEALIRAAGLDPRMRPQDIGIEGFAALARERRAVLEDRISPCESLDSPHM